MASLRALKLSPRSPRRRSRVLLLMLSFEAAVSIWTSPRAKPSTISERTSWTMSCFFGAGPRIFRQAISRTLSSLWFAPTMGICIVSDFKDDGIPVRPEADGAAQVGLVVDPGIGPGVHELRPDGRDPTARHVAAGANDEGGEILGILPQSAQGRIALAEAQLHVRAALVDLDVFAVSDHEKVSLEVAHRIEKRRRIQHHEAQDAAVADVLGGAEAKAETRLAEQRGGALHQRDDGGVADPRIGIAQVGPADTRFLQQGVDRKILPLEIVDDLGCQACMDPGGSDHCRHSAQPWN